MKEQPKTGMNRTGVQMSPFNIAEMTSDIKSMMPEPRGDEQAIAQMRAAYISEADPIGSVPVPGTVKGAFTTGMSALTGNTPQLLIDKLGERLAFERTGTRLYDALINKVQTLQQDGAATVPLEQLMQIRDEEASHFALVANTMLGMGADPTAQTPCADIAGVESMGLLKTVTDPRTTVVQSLHAILVAEMTDNNGWEMLIALAESQGHDAMAADFTTALQHEREHLQMVQSWFEEAMLGSSLNRQGTSDAPPSLH